MLVIAAQAATVPTAPTINVVSVTGNTVTLGLVAASTETVFGVLGYDIYKSSNGFLYDKVATVVDLPYIVPGLTSGATYQFIARGVSAAPGSYRSGPSAAVVGTTTGGVITPTRRIYADWGMAISPAQVGNRPQDAPGAFHGIPNGGTVTGTYPTNVATGGVVSNVGPVCSGVTYLTTRHNWNELDNGDGTYNWAHTDYILAQARGLGVGVYFVILTRTFNVTVSGVDQNPVPADLAAYCEVYTGSGGGNGYQVWRWSPTVLARWQTFINAMGARYDADPFFAGIGTQETSTGGANGAAVAHGTGNYTVSLGALGNFVGSDVYSSTGFTAALEMEKAIIGTASPSSRGLPFNNFIQNDTVAELLVDALSIAIVAQTYGSMWGFPDSVTDLEPGNINGRVYPTVQKYKNGSNGIAHPGLTFGAIQPAEWTAQGPAQTPAVAFPPGPLNPSLQDLYNWLKQTNTYPTSLSTGARDHRPTSASPSPLNVDSILADYRPSASFGAHPNFSDLVPIIQAHPILRTVTPNP